MFRDGHQLAGRCLRIFVDSDVAPALSRREPAKSRFYVWTRKAWADHTRTRNVTSVSDRSSFRGEATLCLARSTVISLPCGSPMRTP